VPLAESSEQLTCLVTYLQHNLDSKNWDSIEIRGADPGLPECTNLAQSQTFFLHKLDLRPSLTDIFRGFHKDCVQRKIKRAAREGLAYEEGRSDSLLAKFYHLLLLTRRRHGLPPQPAAWFRNLVACLGDKVKIRVASAGGRPIASIVTLRYKGVLVYKYGCSDSRFDNLGGTQLLFWKAIQEAKNDHLEELDFGRSECNNFGLVAFKDRWGATRSTLVYLQYPQRGSQFIRGVTQVKIAKRLLTHTPGVLLAAAGRVLYKYMG
jgi:lipid II:glycine glycyltransferase (peptidoglycan interpeptide bridge formation enzyme)